MNGKHKKIILIICVLPFILGTIGFVISGLKITDAFYASFALYFVSKVSDGYNILIEISRWTAVLVTTTAILFVLKEIWNNIVNRLKCMSKDSVAVYCDWDTEILFSSKTKAIYPGRNIKPAAKSHIIMLESDTESLKFYEENKVRLKGKNVYIGLRDFEYGLIKEEYDVDFFDINGSIARELWKSVGIWKSKKESYTITVYGGNILAQNVLNYGLLLNIFSLNQKIVYNFIADNELYQVKHGNINTFNSDNIYYYSTENRKIYDIMEKSDIVVLTEEINADILQTIGVCCRNGKIYYYSPKYGDYGDYLQFDNLFPFGRDKDICTDENIRRGKLTEDAKALNLAYASKYGTEKDWRKLSGFLKWSNISSADFNSVLGYLIQSGINTNTEVLAELEHIRWCRFHNLNYWKYGVPEDGTNKDENKKIHKCLCDYSELSEADKEKDRAIVKKAYAEIRQKDIVKNNMN